MSIEFYTSHPVATLDDMIKLVNEARTIDTSVFWYFEIQTGFNHSAVQWDKVGHFIPTPDSINQRIIFPYKSGERADKAVKNSFEYLHGRFAEFLMIHFGSRMNQILIRDDR
jgi:hypothetical protein